ncbi:MULTISPECIES: restriction endonuclease subunit S [unclassified Pseudomonas]|uniref:restriction endonuclease subunit S n=1 Tax=unclassified Pseudomonas TaxID=196821 RepID=UPI001F34187F|nr:MULTISPECIES: restriction endonuclease subunit S [unclassified Pseudomonas]
MENIESGNGKYLAKDDIAPEGLSLSFLKGDVLFGKLRPYLAKSWLANFSGTCSSEFIVLTDKKTSPGFLHYYTLTDEFINQVNASTYGSKMPRASWDFIGLMAVPIPANESESISNFLDHETAKIDTLIEKQQQLIQLLKEKRQAVISHAVTKGLNPHAKMRDSGVEWLGEVPEEWDVLMVGKATRVYRGKFTHRPRNDPRFYDGDYPFIQTGDIANSEVTIKAYTQTLNDEGIKISQKFPAGTLMMGIVGAKLGSTAILEFDSYGPDSIVGFYPCAELDINYLRYTFLAAIQVLESTATQSAQPNLNIERISAMYFCRPSFEEQKRIASYLAEVEGSINFAEKKIIEAISLMQERRTALISAAVTGKIDVRGWVAPESSLTDKEVAA